MATIHQLSTSLSHKEICHCSLWLGSLPSTPMATQMLASGGESSHTLANNFPKARTAPSSVPFKALHQYAETRLFVYPDIHPTPISIISTPGVLTNNPHNHTLPFQFPLSPIPMPDEQIASADDRIWLCDANDKLYFSGKTGASKLSAIGCMMDGLNSKCMMATSGLVANTFIISASRQVSPLLVPN